MPEYQLPPWLAEGMPWPPADHAERIARIEADRQLFGCDHHEVYAEAFRRLNPDAVEAIREPQTMVELMALVAANKNRGSNEIEVNFPFAVSTLWADLIAGKRPRFRAPSGSIEEQKLAVKRITKRLGGELHLTALEQSIAGNFVLVTKLVNGTGRVEAYPADQWIPWTVGRDVLAHVLWSREKIDEKDYINVEIHYEGHVKYRRFILNGNQLGKPQEPKVPEGALSDHNLPGVRCLVHPGVNIGTTKSVIGLGDYQSIDSIIPQLDVQSSQWGMIFDKHAAPTMQIPASMFEFDETINQWVFRSDPAGKAIPVEPGDPDAKYLVWDAQMQANFEAWQRLWEMAYLATQTTPAAFSIYNEGGASSGTALRLRMARTLAAAQRKRDFIAEALDEALMAAQELETTVGTERYEPVEVVTEWFDGLPRDRKEDAEIEANRKREGLTTTKRAVQRLDDLTEEEAEAEAEEIANEKAAEQAIGGFVMPGARQGLNGPDEGGGGDV